MYFGSEPHCFEHARRKRRVRAVARWSFVVVAVALAGGAAGFLVTRKPPFDYGANKLTIARLRSSMEHDRCARQPTLDYEEALITVGDFHGAVDDAQEFWKKCGDWYRLRWVTYTAYQRAHEYPRAVEEASKLIEHNPNDHDYWWWRGSIYEQMKDFPRAAADYRRSLALLPGSDGIPFNLARVYEAMGQGCRALGPLELYVYEHPDDQRATRDRIIKSAAQRGCLRDGTGAVAIKHYNDPRALDGKVTIASKPAGRFIVATESVYVELSRALAKRLGLDLSKAEPMEIDTDRRQALVTTVPLMAVGEAKARDVEVAVTDLPDGVDGVLGISYLARFRGEPGDDADDDLYLFDWSPENDLPGDSSDDE